MGGGNVGVGIANPLPLLILVLGTGHFCFQCERCKLPEVGICGIFGGREGWPKEPATYWGKPEVGCIVEIVETVGVEVDTGSDDCCG